MIYAKKTPNKLFDICCYYKVQNSMVCLMHAYTLFAFHSTVLINSVQYNTSINYLKYYLISYKQRYNNEHKPKTSLTTIIPDVPVVLM